LTDRQLEILRLVATGLSNAEIARRLVVSTRTMDHHVSAIQAKLGVPTRRDAAAWAAGLEGPPSPASNFGRGVNIFPCPVVLLATIHDTKDTGVMSLSDLETAIATGPEAAPVVRDAVPAHYPAIRGVVIAAYRQYTPQIAREVFLPYLADLLDLEKHARLGRLLVVEADGHLCTYLALYPDASLQSFAWPPGWAGGRALAVHPAARGLGAARAVLVTLERLAREAGAPVFAFHTASFITGAITLYERLGYRRAPEFDFNLAARYGRSGVAPIMSFAYLRHLTPDPGNHEHRAVTPSLAP
jgi:DNA-binding CsgD family transcriptional regulator/GNAT superfamily N-acetyltransferase